MLRFKEGTLTWRDPDVKTEEADFRGAARHPKWRLPDLPTADSSGGIQGGGVSHALPSRDWLRTQQGAERGTISHGGGVGPDL